MPIKTLPTEVWAIIIGQLDTKSTYNLYESCKYFRLVVSSPGVVKECHFSLNTLATAESFNTNFFRDISEHLKVLNLSGIPHLTMSSLLNYLPALKNLNNLKALDISYTKITMPDYLDIVKVLGTLKSLDINFTFGKKYKLTKDLLLQYQLALEGLETVHFVGSKSDLLFGKLAVCMLDKAKIFRLTFTVHGKDFINDEDEEDEWTSMMMANIKEFRIHFLADTIGQPMLELPVFKHLDLKNYEILLFQDYLKSFVHASPFLKEIICKNFDVEVKDLSELFSVVVAECAVLLWHKDVTQKSSFDLQLLNILKEYLDYNFDSSNLAPVPANFKWYSVQQCSPLIEGRADTSLVLNYDDAFKEKTNIKLNIKFLEPLDRPVTINSSDLFKKLSHLSLFGNVKYSSNFFKTLFDCCDSLVTLQIIERQDIFSVDLLEFLPNNKCLKNLFIELRDMNYFALFTYLSQCKSLQNIYLVNSGKPVRSLPNPRRLFICCNDLYNICIRTDMYKYVRAETLKMYETVKFDLCKDALNIDIYLYTGGNYQYRPYFCVFSFYKLRPL